MVMISFMTDKNKKTDEDRYTQREGVTQIVRERDGEKMVARRETITEKSKENVNGRKRK